jgi:hypothetical protein
MFWNKADAVFNGVHTRIYYLSVDVNVMFVNEASAVLNGVPHQNLHPFVDVTKEECQLMQW